MEANVSKSAVRIAFLSFLTTLAVWIVFTWPLPANVLRGIPSSSRASCGQRVRYMIPGDHLQLLYRFWLFDDMLGGRTEWRKNVYEFNTGEDEESARCGSSYLPFSLAYALLSRAGGRAFGWNMTGLVSLWFTCIFTWWLVSRYVRDRWIVVFAAVIGIALPYRFEALLGGSPTGFAMVWIPMLLLGLDVAVRDERMSGGILAGAALLFAYLSDRQIFFFACLAAPAWCFVALVNCKSTISQSPGKWRRILRSLSPALLLGAVSVLLLLGLRSELSDSAHMSEPRSMREVALFSPSASKLFSWNDKQLDLSQVYLGYVPILIIVAGFIVLYWRGRKGHATPWREAGTLVLTTVGILLVAVLALGPRGPFGGGLFAVVRKIIPPYAMIRQPAKVFCVLPTIMAVAAAVSLSLFFGGKRLRLLPAALALLVTFEYARHVTPEICLLTTQQEAYQTVLDDASGEGRTPRILAIPLWPGDSHWSSLYQHYVSLYRIRMMNGYSPVVKREYYDKVFMEYRGVNSGAISDDQLDELRNRGVGYLVLHEDAFPEKVSPFPVSFTLKRLMNHARLRLLVHAGHVWAFKILPGTTDKPDTLEHWDVFFPARHFEGERWVRDGAIAVDDPECVGGRFARLAKPGESIRTRTRGMTYGYGARWIIRARGEGIISAVLRDKQKQILGEGKIKTDEDQWHWIEFPLPRISGYTSASLALTCESGSVDIDTLLLAAGSWHSPGPGETNQIPAPCFFHAGYTQLEQDSVVVRKEWQPDSRIFYGPRLPLEKGNYVATFHFASAAARDTVLGQWHLEPVAAVPGSSTPVVQGRHCQLPFAIHQNVPVMFSFTYSGKADMEIESIELTRKTALDSH